MKIDKANKRDKKNFKSQHGMQTSNKSVFLLASISTGKKKKSKKNARIIDNTKVGK